jgi:hypothetical protein
VRGADVQNRAAAHLTLPSLRGGPLPLPPEGRRGALDTDIDVRLIMTPVSPGQPSVWLREATSAGSPFRDASYTATLVSGPRPHSEYYEGIEHWLAGIARQIIVP